jgi:hypothetical protein
MIGGERDRGRKRMKSRETWPHHVRDSFQWPQYKLLAALVIVSCWCSPLSAYWLHITLHSYVLFAFYTHMLGQNLSNPGLLNHLYKFCNKKHFIFIETYASPRIKNAHNIGRCLNVMGDAIGAVTNSTLAHSSSHVEWDGITLFWGLQRKLQENYKWNCPHIKKPSADNKWAEME